MIHKYIINIHIALYKLIQLMRYQYQLLNFFEAALKFSISSKYKPVAAVSFLFYVFILCTLADMCVDTCSPPLFFFSTSCLFHAQINISVSGWKSQNLLKMQTFTANFTWCYLEVRLKIEEIWIWIIFIWPSLCTQKKNLTLTLLSACTKKKKLLPRTIWVQKYQAERFDQIAGYEWKIY